MSSPSAFLVWNGYEVTANFTCTCGADTEKDVGVGDVIECSGCHQIWRPLRTVACEPATAREIADYRARYYGEGI